jgi:hypothetical protein
MNGILDHPEKNKRYTKSLAYFILLGVIICFASACSTSNSASYEITSADVHFVRKLDANLKPLPFDSVTLYVSNKIAFLKLPYRTKLEIIRAFKSAVGNQLQLLQRNRNTTLRPKLMVKTSDMHIGIVENNFAFASALSTADNTSALDPTIVSNYGGPNNPTYNIIGTPEVIKYYPCLKIATVNVCGGAAAGWVQANSEGVIINVAEATGIAIVSTDQWLGVAYTAKAPSGSPSAITIQATVYTQDENGGVTVAGASCAPVSVFEDYPQNGDYPTSNQTQQINITSCYDSLSVQIPTLPFDSVGNLGLELLDQTINLVNYSNGFVNALNTLSGTYNTTTLYWSGLVWGGSTVEAYVDPFITAANAGVGTVVNAARSLVSFTITDVYGGGGGCDHCHPETPGSTPALFGLSLSQPQAQPGTAAPLEKVTITGANLGNIPGTVIVGFCNKLYVTCTSQTTVTVPPVSWTPNSIVFYLPGAYKCGEGTVSIQLPDGKTPAGSPMDVHLYSSTC